MIPWAIACQAPLSMEFSRQEYWSGLLFPSPGDLPDPRSEPGSPASRADSLPPEPPGVVNISVSAVPGLNCSMWDLVPSPGIEPRSPTWGARSLSHWTTREVLVRQNKWEERRKRKNSTYKIHSEDPLISWRPNNFSL